MNRWFSGDGILGMTPSSASPGGSSRPPPSPPDPPDPLSPSYLALFPPLSSPSSSLSPHSPIAQDEPENVVLGLPAHHIPTPIVVNTVSAPLAPLSATAVNPFTIPPKNPNFPSLPNSQFLPSNQISTSLGSINSLASPASPSSALPPPSSLLGSPPVISTLPQSPPLAAAPPLATNANQVPKSWAERIKKGTSKKLETVQGPTPQISETGKPRIAIPDEVFQEGENLLKEFVYCRFKGRPPSFNQIQSVLTHLWGKGRKLEIHLNKPNCSMLVKIPNEYIRVKVLEKKLWYVGECMFTVSKWQSNSVGEDDPDSIPIWAHLKGIPTDLIHPKGLSLVGKLIGRPKEMDDFTKNLVSLSEAHVFVEVNLKVPLPKSVEVERSSGQIITIDVEYPWTPPICSHCKELGHVLKYCPTATLAWVPKKPVPPNIDPDPPSSPSSDTHLPDPHHTSPPPPIPPLLPDHPSFEPPAKRFQSSSSLDPPFPGGPPTLI